MKIEISDEHYFELIKDIFGEIYKEIRISTKSQNEFYYCELGGGKLNYYPNFDIDEGEIVYPNFTDFEYISEPKELEIFFSSKLREKYEQYLGKQTAYQKVTLNEYSFEDEKSFYYETLSHNYDVKLSEAVFEEAIFQQVFSYINLPNSIDETNTIIDSTDYIKKLKNGEWKFFPDDIINDKIESLTLKNNENIYLSSINNNVFVVDTNLFWDFNKKKVDAIINSSKFNRLLKLENDISKTPNPFINVFYNMILTQFILFETHFENAVLCYDSIYLKCDLNLINQERLIALSYMIMSCVESEKQYLPCPFKFTLTNQKISRLIYKAIVLVINQKVSEQNRYTQKFNSLFDLGTQEDINLSETYINRIKRIYEKANQKAQFKSELTAKNIVTLFYLLKQYKAINYRLKDTEIRTLVELLTSYSDNTLKEYVKELNKNIRESSMEDGYLKSRAAENYKLELMVLLEKMIADLKK